MHLTQLHFIVFKYKLAMCVDIHSSCRQCLASDSGWLQYEKRNAQSNETKGQN